MGTALVEDTVAAEGAWRLRQALSRDAHSRPASQTEQEDACDPCDLAAGFRGASSIHVLRRVFNVLDPLRNILETSLGGWQPPQVVVIGEENSGKSSVLERIAMMPIFPRNQRLCTRMPIHVRLRNAHKSMPATLEVFNTQTNQTEEEAYVIPTEFGVTDVTAKMQEIIAKEHGDLARAVSTQRIIILTIEGPHVPSIDLIDMPGLVSAPTELKAQTAEIFDKHMAKFSPCSLFLATVRATTAPNTSLAIEMIQARGLHNRTVGVFTMCDHAMAIPDFQNAFLERIQPHPPVDCGAVALEPYGWVCVMNAPVDVQQQSAVNTCANFARLKCQAAAEEAFMREKMPTAFQEGRAGCDALVQRLSTLFMQFISRSWVPRTIQLIDKALDDTRLENTNLGLPEFDRPGSDHAQRAREACVADAKRKLQHSKRELVEACIKTGPVHELTSQLRAITSELLSADLCELPVQWRNQRDRLMTECKHASHALSEYWIQSIINMLQQPDPPQQPSTKAKTTPANQSKDEAAVFQLARFPNFISMVRRILECLVVGAEEQLVEDLEFLIKHHYSTASSAAAVRLQYGSDGKTMTLCLQKNDKHALMDSITFCFLEHSTVCILEKLSNVFEAASTEVDDDGWVETCAPQRRALAERVRKLTEVKNQIFDMLGSKSGLGLLRVSPGVVEGQCQYIKGFAGSVGSVAIDQFGHVFAVDQGDCTIKVFSGEGPEGKLIRKFRCQSQPTGLCIGRDGDIYVCDQNVQHITVYSHGGEKIRQIDGVTQPVDVAVDCNNVVYVTSTRSPGFVILNDNGCHVETSSSYDHYIAPYPNGSSYIAVDEVEGRVIVAKMNSSIQEYRNDGKGACHMRSQIPSRGGIALDHNGMLYVAAGSETRVYDKQGKVIMSIPCDKAQHVAVDGLGQVLVSEGENRRILVVRK